MNEEIKEKMDKIEKQLGKMDDSIKAEPERRQQRKQWLLWALLAVIVVIVAVSLAIGKKDSSEEQKPSVQEQQTVVEAPKEEPKIDHQAIYKEQVIQFTDTLHNTLLSRYQDEMTDAQTKAVKDIQKLFEAYQTRIPRFAKDLTSFTNRMKTLGKSVQDIFSKDKEHVTRLAQETFAKDVFSNEELSKELNDILTDYEENIQRARTTYYQNCEMEIRKLDHIADVSPTDLETLALENLSFDASIGGKNSFINLGVSVAAGTVGLIGLKAATGALAGASIGLVIPGPVDDVIAIGIGAIVDQSMAKKNRAELETDYTAVLASMEQNILNGSEETEGFTGQTDRYQLALADADRQEVLDNLKMKDSFQ
jgi:archaellum component FlaC